MSRGLTTDVRGRVFDAPRREPTFTPSSAARLSNSHWQSPKISGPLNMNELLEGGWTITRQEYYRRTAAHDATAPPTLTQDQPRSASRYPVPAKRYRAT